MLQVWDVKTTDCVQTFKPPPPLRVKFTTLVTLVSKAAGSLLRWQGWLEFVVGFASDIHTLLHVLKWLGLFIVLIRVVMQQ
jgi:hypothetical protein